MTRKTSKTPLEIAQELQAKADRAKVRAVKSSLETLPVLQPLYDRLEAEKKAVIEAQRKQASIATRLASVEARHKWINAEASYLGLALESSKEVIQYLTQQLSKLALSAADGKEIKSEDVENILDGSTVVADHDIVRKALCEMQQAEETWRNIGKTARTYMVANSIED
jgi:argininosuccinate lyase